MDPVTGMVIGAGAQAITNTASGIINNKANKRAQQRQFEMQKKLNEQAHELNYEQWQRTNTPAQVMMMKEAGLNPALMYGGGGGASGTTTAGSGGSASMQAPSAFNIGIDAMQMAQMKAQIDNIKADTDKKTAEKENLEGVDRDLKRASTQDLIKGIENKEAQKHLTEAQTRMQELENNIAERTTEDQIELAEWTSEKAMQDVLLARNETFISNSTLNEKIKIIQQDAIGSVLQNAVLKQGIELSKAQVNKLYADIAQGWQKLTLEAEKNKQGWEGLSNDQKRIAIQEFSEEIKANNPSIMNVAGGVVDQTINGILNLPAKLGIGNGGRQHYYKVDK